MSKKHRGGQPSRSGTTTARPSTAPDGAKRTAPPSPQPKTSRNVLIAASLGVVAVVVAGALALGGMGGDGSRTAAATATPHASGAAVAAALPADIDPSAAAARWESGAVLVDVREPSEWNAGHVPGAEHIPLGELAARVGELPADTEILVICRSGNRSQQGRDILTAAGLSPVASVNGGVRAWRDAGLPYEGDIS